MATLAASEATHTHASRSGRRIRACMVSYFFSPNYSGSAIQARNLSRHLRQHGIDSTIVSANLSGSTPYDVVDGLPVYRLPVVRTGNLRIPSFWISFLAFLFRHRRDFDLVHAHGMLPHGTVSIGGALIGIPSILKVAMADSDIAFERQGRAMGMANRFLVERFDRYIATTDAIAREFESQRLDVSRVRRIPNGVDTEVYAPLDPDRRSELRQRLGLPPVPIVLYAGIMNRRKNVDGAVRIWRTAVIQGAPGHLVLLGPVDEQDRFVAELRALMALPELAGRVSLVGFRDNVPDYLRAADLFLFPSMQEGMPNVVLEAMASALPPLVSAAAGTDAIVSHGRNGLSLPVSDEPGFAAAIVDLLQHPQRAIALGVEARRTIESRFSLPRIAAEYARLYRELVPSASGQRRS